MSSSPASARHPESPSPNLQDPARDAFDTPLFHRLLGLIEKQNDAIEQQKVTLKEQKETMDEQQRTLRQHGGKLDELVKDAQRDNLPYDEEASPVYNEQLWSGVYEISAARMREEAEEWKEIMDVSLVFIAIFLTVLTAFLVPAAQALNRPPSGTPSNSTAPPPPLPPESAQNVCALYYLALIMAMCNAVLCVLGRQWVGKLLSRPIGETHRERTMRREARKRLAYGWIKPLVTILYWSLLLSISLFIFGLLYQLRNLSTSFDQPAPILETTWSLGIFLAALILGTIAVTTIHAIRFESSLFEGLLSELIVKILQRFEGRWKWIKDWRVSVDWKSPECLYRTSMELIAEANDPKLLDRVASSFSYLAWVWFGRGSTELLDRAYDRLMASDTSIRVRETVIAQMSRFAKICQEYPPAVEEPLGMDDFDHILRYRYSLPADFPARATILSFQENNGDLLEVGALPVNECIARILCTYDQDKRLGDRRRLFEAALRHCASLVATGKQDDVIQILSHVDCLAIVRSFMRAPDRWVSYSKNFFPFLVRDRQVHILHHVTEFLRNPPSDINYDNISFILSVLLPSKFSLPLSIDFSPIFAHVIHGLHEDSWGDISASLLRYLEECDMSVVSDHLAIVTFLQCCANPDIRTAGGIGIRTQAQYLLDTLHVRPRITPLPPSRPSTPPPSIDRAFADNSMLNATPVAYPPWHTSADRISQHPSTFSPPEMKTRSMAREDTSDSEPRAQYKVGWDHMKFSRSNSEDDTVVCSEPTYPNAASGVSEQL
ncbi:hypothetical protein SISNIDRAFT_542449 [Sistotremastrum niveocremeum HHB9708]|uniref:DUF6535 domain-containing protein n=1 Tax=Sistotremastrum niveocremeum HHB9708 TaxID=1314777 RepID=A0A164X3E4_9AGAM|nr:hypothetical protein SISNIDRAFT_542449 [Sistotremastrum niveocremeum HHB9708]